MAKQPPKSDVYNGPCVVYNHTRYQDCWEERSKMFATVAEAMKWLNDQREDPSAMDTYQLFKVGEEIPLASNKVEIETRTVKTKTQYKVKG